LKGNWQRPRWEVFEALAFHGREDKVSLQINSVVNRRINWSIGSGGRRIGITNVPNGYTSILLATQFFFYCVNTNPSIAFNYTIDAEYVKQIKTKIGVSGQPYNPVPLTSFENHTLKFYLFYTWLNNFHLSCFGGETFNRLGTKDSTYGIDMKYVKPCPKGIEFELSAYKFPSITVQGAQAIFVTGTLSARF